MYTLTRTRVLASAPRFSRAVSLSAVRLGSPPHVDPSKMVTENPDNFSMAPDGALPPETAGELANAVAGGWEETGDAFAEGQSSNPKGFSPPHPGATGTGTHARARPRQTGGDNTLVDGQASNPAQGQGSGGAAFNLDAPPDVPDVTPGAMNAALASDEAAAWEGDGNKPFTPK